MAPKPHRRVRIWIIMNEDKLTMRDAIAIPLLVTILILGATYGVNSMKKQTDPWLDPVIMIGELNSTKWINENTKKTDKFQSDIFGGELIMGMTTRTAIVGGDWANAPDPVSNMKDSQKIYMTTSASEANALCKKYNVTYAFVPLNRNVYCGFGWIVINKNKFNDYNYFRLAYSNDDVKIFKVV
ncbi:MAG TPA: hypothetical protein VED16_03190 [Candidatus Acidoferrum sp.]|nr:hypothetical protein [Candidatus Acidoferrum sp.]